MNQGRSIRTTAVRSKRRCQHRDARRRRSRDDQVGSLGFFPAMDVVARRLPMVLSLLKMALVICIPLVLLFGTYRLKALVAVSCVEFALCSSWTSGSSSRAGSTARSSMRSTAGVSARIGCTPTSIR